MHPLEANALVEHPLPSSALLGVVLRQNILGASAMHPFEVIRLVLRM